MSRYDKYLLENIGPIELCEEIDSLNNELEAIKLENNDLQETINLLYSKISKEVKEIKVLFNSMKKK